MASLKSVLKWGDLLIAGLILLLAGGIVAGFVWYGQGGGHYAVLFHNHQEVARFPLNHDDSFTFQGRFTAQIEVKDGKARFVSSGCPDQVCVVSGWLSKRGQTAVCVPNQLVLKVIGGEADDGVDILVE